MNGFFTEKMRPIVLGHRGVPKLHQENTLAGFRKAVELGVDGVELDVFKTKDDRIVVFHDEDTERLTGVKGKITEMTWEQVASLKIQRSVDRGDGIVDKYPSEQRIPLLQEVLEELSDQLLFNIEMKAYAPKWSRRHTGSEVAQVVRKARAENSVISTSFDFFMLKNLENEYPDIHSGFAYDAGMLGSTGEWLKRFAEYDSELSIREGNQNDVNLLNILLEANIIGRFISSAVVAAEHTLIDSDTIEKFHNRNMLVGGYTLFPIDTRYTDDTGINHYDEVKRLSADGIDWLETDDPELLLNLLTN